VLVKAKAPSKAMPATRGDTLTAMTTPGNEVITTHNSIKGPMDEDRMIRIALHITGGFNLASTAIESGVVTTTIGEEAGAAILVMIEGGIIESFGQAGGEGCQIMTDLIIVRGTDEGMAIVMKDANRGLSSLKFLWRNSSLPLLSSIAKPWMVLLLLQSKKNKGTLPCCF
jgi:hypothetical protein